MMFPEDPSPSRRSSPVAGGTNHAVPEAPEPPERAEEDAPPILKPLLRGRFHQAAFLAAIPAALILVAFAHSTAARVVAVIYGLGLIGLFGTSAAYHRLEWTARARSVMKRLDHSMIYALIAATYTPFGVLVLHRPLSVVLLTLVVTGAVIGILLKVFALERTQVIGSALYIVLGWLVVLAAPQIWRALNVWAIVPLVLGGLLYTAGAIVLATRKPDPKPTVFGYHEVWHLSTVLAGACHYVAVLQVVLAAR